MQFYWRGHLFVRAFGYAGQWDCVRPGCDVKAWRTGEADVLDVGEAGSDAGAE